MATMPSTLTVKVIHDPVTPCPNSNYGTGEHNFNEAQGATNFILLFCDQCGMMLDVRFDDDSRS